MSRPPVGLGIDVGTTNTKVVLVRVPDDGPVELLAVASAPTPAPRELTGTLRSLVREAVAAAGEHGAPDAVGVASMAETGVPLDADGAPLGDWFRWDGHRAAAQAAALADRLGATALFEATGVRPSAKVPLATLAWLAAHDPALRAAMARWSGVADLAHLALTGDLVTDHTLAGRTMAYRLPVVGEPLPDRFDAALLAEVGLRPEHLPRVVGPLADAAPAAVTAAWAGSGLRPGTPVTVAGHDHAVGAWAAGVRGPGDVADSLGTAEAVYTVLDADPEVRRAVARAGMSLVRTVEGRPALLAGSSSAGAMVRWWLEHEAPGRTAEQLFDEVAALPPAAHPRRLVVLPYVQGRQTPEPDPAARVRVVGERAGHGRAALAAAMVDGLCLQARWMLDEQLRLAGGGVRPRALVVLGGPATRNAAWMRAKARVTPAPLRLVDSPEPVAAGAALLALHRAGVLAGGAPALPTVAGPGVPGAGRDGSGIDGSGPDGPGRAGSAIDGPGPDADVAADLERFIRAARAASSAPAVPGDHRTSPAGDPVAGRPDPVPAQEARP